MRLDWSGTGTREDETWGRRPWVGHAGPGKPRPDEAVGLPAAHHPLCGAGVTGPGRVIQWECLAGHNSRVTPTELLAQLAAEYWEGLLRRNPTTATFYADFRFNDRLPDVGPDGRAEEQTANEVVLARLGEIPREALGAHDRVTWDMLRLAAESTLTGLRLRLDEMAVDQMQGPQVWLPELLNWHPTDTQEHVQELVARFRAFPLYMAQYLEALQDGVRDGRTATRIVTERVVGQLDALLATPPAESPLVGPAGSLPVEQAGPLLAAVEEAVYPAYRRMRAYLGGEYLDRHARLEPGVWAVTDGDEIYAALARQHTTTDLGPAELHRIGRTELAWAHAEMRTIMARHGDHSGNIRAFTERLTADPANQPASAREIVAAAEQYLELARAALPRAFGRLPALPCIVKPMEAFRERDAVAAFYFPPAGDGSRPGTFYVNTFEPSSRPRHTLPALVFHEGLPGHHLQIALAQETEDLPAFRRLSAGWLANAFVEGWALYTERLADELGLYPDDLARFGMLGYQAWRACRLVVDTGLHSLHWSREQAIEYFLQNVGLTEHETANEVDRYIIWPGQALSYKVGQREIEAQRRQAQARLGAHLDQRAFHDEVLRYGAVPLSTLRLMMSEWTEQIASSLETEV